MKKGLQVLAMMVVMVCILLIGATVNAEVLPVKDAWILNEDLVAVLREDGTFLIANGIDAEKAEFTANDVADFYGSARKHYSVTTFQGIILYNNGDVAMIYSPSTEKSIYATAIVGKNAKEIYQLQSFTCAYIDNNNVLRAGTYSNLVENTVTIMENVKRCYDSDNAIYVITTDDTLFCVDVIRDTKSEIMTNVKDIKETSRGDLLILRNNGDLYLCKSLSDNKFDTPIRIGTNIEDMSKVVFEDTSASFYGIEYVNKNGEYFAGSADNPEMKKYMDNVRDVYNYDGSKYAITNDNTLYCYINKPNGKGATKIYNVQKMFDGLQSFFLGTDNKVYKCGNYNYFFITDDVKEMIVYDVDDTDNGRYLFIKNDGTLYGAYAKGYFEPKTPFITSFCQKTTKVIINNQNIELTSKIQMVNNRSMYPFRECLENMGATVLWDNTNKIAIGEYNGITIEFPIDKSEYWINGIKYEMDTKSYVDNSIGRTYIPIRYAAEGLGFTVDWVEEETENIISIHK